MLKFLTPLLEDKLELMTNHLKLKPLVGSDKSTKFVCQATYGIYKRHTNRQKKWVISVRHFS
jgi:hypothetical protein